MTESSAAKNTPPSGSGCATAFGIGLLVTGGFFLWANLSGTPVARLLLSVLPLAAVWWPLLLVVWGASKVVTRIRTGRARFGFGEVVLLLLLILGGTLFTLAQRAIESQGLEFRLLEIGRLLEHGSGQHSRHRFDEERTISLPAGDGTDISISLPAGNIQVDALTVVPAAAASGAPAIPPVAARTAIARSGPEGRIRLAKHVWAADREQAADRAAAVRLVTEPMDGETGFRIRVDDAGASEVALELFLTLPPGVHVVATSGEGSVQIRGPFAGAEVRTSDGLVEVRGPRGAVSLTARDGAIRASGIGGALHIRGRRTVIEAESVDGAIRVESEGAPVWISEAGSSVNVLSRNAPVEVSDSSGPIEIETRISPVGLARIEGPAVVRSDFGSVLATAIAGTLRIRAESASIEVRNARSGVDIQAEGGSILVEDVGGPLTVASGRGEVRGALLSGPADFTGEAGAITVRGFGDSLTVTGGDARVDVATGSLGGEVALTTERGDVRLTLPSAGSFALSARTASGALVSDFPLEEVATDGSSRWNGLTGSGAEGVTISTRQGDIVVQARPPAGENR